MYIDNNIYNLCIASTVSYAWVRVLAGKVRCDEDPGMSMNSVVAGSTAVALGRAVGARGKPEPPCLVWSPCRSSPKDMIASDDV